MVEFIMNHLSNFVSAFAVIVSAFAVGISFFAIVYTRKNLKTQKYIDTITKQRIIWIDILRNDFSDILAHIEKIRYCHYVEERDRKVGYDAEGGTIEDHIEYTDFVKFSREEKKKLETHNYEITTKIELSILRLNDKDDAELIKKLTELKKIYQERNYYNRVGDDLIVNLRNEIKKILKTEWETVKLETIEGGFIKKDKKKHNKCALIKYSVSVIGSLANKRS